MCKLSSYTKDNGLKRLLESAFGKGERVHLAGHDDPCEDSGVPFSAIVKLLLVSALMAIPHPWFSIVFKYFSLFNPVFKIAT